MQQQHEGSSPAFTVTQLLAELKKLKAVAMDVAYANAWLAPKLRLILSSMLEEEARQKLSQLLEVHAAWDTGSLSFKSARPEEPAGQLDLVKLISQLQRWLYVRLQQLGSGTYSVVYKAQNRETSETLAVKKLLHTDATLGGFPDSVVREISILQEMRHDNVVRLKDIITNNMGGSHVYLVLECLDCDLRTYLNTCTPSPNCIKSIMLQIIKGIEHVHTNLVLHRDLKPENVLVNTLPDASGSEPPGERQVVVKLTDFGLARQYLPPQQEYTGKVVTLYYRAPELLLSLRCYSTAVDMWSVGCILAELFNSEPLFRDDTEIGLLKKVFETLGTPSREQWPEFHELQNRFEWTHFPGRDLKTVCPRLADDPQGLDLLSRLLTYDPSRRISARQARVHPWFRSLEPAAASGASSSGAGSRPAAAASGASFSGAEDRPVAAPSGASSRGTEDRLAI